jgi:hypothetical protein
VMGRFEKEEATNNNAASSAASHPLLCSSHSLVIFISELLLQNSLDMSIFQSCLTQYSCKLL